MGWINPNQTQCRALRTNEQRVRGKRVCFPKIAYLRWRRFGRPCLPLVQVQIPTRWTICQGVVGIRSPRMLYVPGRPHVPVCKASISLFRILDVGTQPPSVNEKLWSLMGCVQAASREGPRTQAGPSGQLPGLLLTAVPFPLAFCHLRACSLPASHRHVEFAPGCSRSQPVPHLSASTQGKSRGFYQETFPFGWKERWKGGHSSALRVWPT